MRDRRLGFMYCIQKKGSHYSPQDWIEVGAPLPGDFRVITCPTPPQMNDFCDLLGTPDAPVSKIVSVKYLVLLYVKKGWKFVFDHSFNLCQLT